MFEYVIEQFENKDTSQNMFFFGITMQNHGGYEYSENDFIKTISLEGYANDYPDVEQYLSLIHETDKAVEYMINYFQNVDEPVIILFFGDHLPQLNEAFYEEVHGEAFDTLEEQMLKYTIPFFIWTNYDTEERYIEHTSLNYLSTYLLELVGIDSSYNSFLNDVQAVIPSMNVQGYYSISQNKYIKYEDASGEEKTLLNQYAILQYNGMFDKQNRSEVFYSE